MQNVKSHIFSGGKVIINILILKVFLSQIAFGQFSESNFCGTPDLTSYIGDAATIRYEPDLRRNTVDYYPVQIFSVAKSNGDGRLSDVDMLRGLCQLNRDFLEYGIQFFMKDPVRYINNDNYFEHNQSNGYRMMRNHNATGVFNIYIVRNPNETCGYFSPANEAVAVAQSCFIGGTHALTHEMGHFFGLPHTFQGWEQRTYDKTNVPAYLSIRGRDTVYVETVDGSNCKTSGDGFCDTPPDYISERWNCAGNGLSTKLYYDPNGTEFHIDGTNFMSYAEDRCQNMFTPEQVDRMHHILQTRYSSRRYKFIPPGKVSGSDMTLVSPAYNSEVDLNGVVLSWNPLPEAEQYIVQLSILSGVLFEKYNKMLQYTTSETSIAIPPSDLLDGQTFYWRVFPLNPFTFCPEPSTQSSFKPEIPSNTHVLPDGDQVRVDPNLLHAGNPVIRVYYRFTSPRQVRLNLYNLKGQLISSSDERVMGEMNSSYHLRDLTAGLYLLHISDGENMITQKLMVQ